MDAGDVVEHKVERHSCRVFSTFLLKALVTRVNRRIDIRIVRFCRST